LKSDPNKYPAGRRPQTEWFACQLLSVDYMLGSFFDPEDGGIMFFLNVDGHTSEYTMLHSYHSENIISTI
jgi:hypothetical protein